MNTTAPRTAGRSLSWRVVDIVIASVLAVACALVFFFWNNVVSPATSAATAGFPPLAGLVGGAWLLAGPLGGLVIRKPGAALYCELLAAVVSALLGSTYGITVILSGLIQGIGAELVFAVFLYRRFGLAVSLLCGLVAGLFMTISENMMYYVAWSPGYQALYVLFGTLSGVVLAGLVAWLLTRALVATGVLDSVAAGKDARRARTARAGA